MLNFDNAAVTKGILKENFVNANTKRTTPVATDTIFWYFNNGNTKPIEAITAPITPYIITRPVLYTRRLKNARDDQLVTLTIKGLHIPRQCKLPVNPSIIAAQVIQM